jgi:hypothetical protein
MCCRYAGRDEGNAAGRVASKRKNCCRRPRGMGQPTPVRRSVKPIVVERASSFRMASWQAVQRHISYPQHLAHFAFGGNSKAP